MVNQPYVLQIPTGRPANAAQATDHLIASALKMNASDLHIGVNHTKVVPEPFLLRVRTHGKLQVVRATFLTPLYKEVIGRLKVLAGLDTTDIGTPQDGQINILTPDGLSVVLRISIIPGAEGDEIVIRIQRGEERNLSIENLEMSPAMQTQLNNLIHQKSGLMVINGPAGSGKTTTIYSILKTIASPEKKVLTAEDPIETRLPYVSHTQVTHKTNFNSLARAFMRQDSDVIFIGEVRDAESASAAVQLSQTGHLVLTTLHTRDAVGVIPRLEAFEIHSNFIASSLIGSMAQRLVPRLCPHCRQLDLAEADDWNLLASIVPPATKPTIYKAGPGCPHCISGYIGRKPVFELFVVDPELADMINRRCSTNEIVTAAKRKGMRTLAEDIVLNVFAGHCDIDSVKGFLLSAAFDYNAA